MENNFPPEVREAALAAYNGFSVLSTDRAEEFHHRVPNTKANRKRFPNFLQSIFNCAPVSRRDHIERKHELDIPLKVADAYEEALIMLKEEGIKLGLEEAKKIAVIYQKAFEDSAPLIPPPDTDKLVACIASKIAKAIEQLIKEVR